VPEWLLSRAVAAQEAAEAIAVSVQQLADILRTTKDSAELEDRVVQYCEAVEEQGLLGDAAEEGDLAQELEARGFGAMAAEVEHRLSFAKDGKTIIERLLELVDAYGFDAASSETVLEEAGIDQIRQFSVVPPVFF
jgi:alkanesulfonate monooxygenase SsuD/methylene tetrahydromethanopterin reductase-like flavin-dependent oxidoreductase (luciferase family)